MEEQHYIGAFTDLGIFEVFYKPIFLPQSKIAYVLLSSTSCLVILSSACPTVHPSPHHPLRIAEKYSLCKNWKFAKHCNISLSSPIRQNKMRNHMKA
jgi:hypothetical protein